jgi:hypothetical protein
MKNLEALRETTFVFSICMGILAVIAAVVIGSLRWLGPWGPAYTAPPLMFLATFFLVRSTL